jgi:hypothetical protein
MMVETSVRIKRKIASALGGRSFVVDYDPLGAFPGGSRKFLDAQNGS